MKKHILVIEDNTDVRENIAEILELSNYQVSTANNGKEGVKAAKSKPPDLIICDIMMPELDGYEVLYLLSKDEKTAGIPFIYLTAKSEPTDFRRGMNSGADDYITKPFEELDLLNAIEGRLQRTEALQRNFEPTIEGVSEFIGEASGFNELKKLSLDKTPKQYKKKEHLYHEGDYPNGIFLVQKGKVKAYKINEDGKELITQLFQKGDFIGYQAILENENYKDAAAAIEDTEIVKIPRDAFLDLIHSNREVSRSFVRLLSNNLSKKEDDLLNLAYNSVRKRVADALILLEEKYKEDESEFSMSISRDDLSSIVGTSTESVIRTISEFKEEGLVAVKGSKITVLDSGRLRNLKY